MKKHYIFLLLAAASTLAISGCMEKELLDPNEDNVIRFGVSTEYDNGEATRTEYTGVDENNAVITNSSTVERINWLSTDRIRIVSAETKEANQVDFAITPQSDKSKASVTPVTSGSQLLWNGTQDHYFYAVYPAPTQTGAPSGVSITTASGHTATVTGSIPSSQTSTWDASTRTYKPNMNYAYMYAAKKQNQSAGTNVSLEFKPLVTAFEFSLVTNSDYPVSANLTSVELSSSTTSLAGSFRATLDQNGLADTPSTSGESNRLTISFGNGVQLSKTDPVKFTFLALPKDQTNLTLTLNFAGGLTRTLQLKDGGSFINVAACKKVYITNLATPGIIYYDMDTIADITISGEGVLDDNNRAVTVNTEKDVVNGYTGVDRDLRKTPWKAYFVDGSKSRPAKGTVITGNADYSPTAPAWLTYSTGGSGAGKDDAFNFTIKGTSLIGASVLSGKSASADAMIKNLKDKNLGTVDLSTRDFFNGNTVSAETANCYIIDGYGTFLIPLVYGNAIKNGTTNSVAYTGSAAGSSVHYLTQFVNADGKAITTPYILSDNNLTKPSPYNGCVVWQDTQKTFEIVKDSDIKIYTSKPSGAALSCGYLEFKIRQENIKPGNVIIAIRDKNNKILWSWHIWVRSNITSAQASSVKDNHANTLHAHRVTYLRRPDGNLFQGKDQHDIYFLSEPLGWTPPLSYQGGHTNARSEWVAIVSTETQAVLGSFKVTQNAYTQTGYDVSSYNIYSALYYQWGRKDPFLPTNGKSENKIATSSAGYQVVTSSTTLKTYNFSAEGPSMISYGIQHPNEFNSNYENTNSAGVDVDSYRNLWDSDCNAQDQDSDVKKTIYDPSPRGYTVTRTYAFTGGVRNGEDRRDGETEGLFNTRVIYSQRYGERDGNNYNSEWPHGRRMTDTYDNSSYTLWIPAIGWRGYSGSDVNYQYSGTTDYGIGPQMYYWTAGATEARYTQYNLNRIQACSLHSADNLFIARNHDCRTDGFPIIPTQEGD